MMKSGDTFLELIRRRNIDQAFYEAIIGWEYEPKWWDWLDYFKTNRN